MTVLVPERAFHSADPRASLTVQDHGPHLRARLSYRGPLDDTNIDKALDWVRRVFLEQLTKPAFVATPTGEVLLFREGGQLRVERLLKRRRVE